MGSSRDGNWAPYGCRYISWCAEGPEPPTPAAAEAAQKTPDPAAPGPAPPPPLPPPEQTSATFSRQPSESGKEPVRSGSASPPDTTAARGGGDTEDGWEGGRGEGRPSETNDKRFHLPRSSPVIIRRHRPVSWQGGGADASSPTSPDPTTPARTSESQDQRARLTVGGADDLGSRPRSCPQEETKHSGVSASSNLNHFLSSLFHLPFGGQRAAGEDRGGACEGPRSPDAAGRPEDICKSSCELEKENAHFIVVDLVLEVLEGAKWSLTLERPAPSVRRRDACRLVRSRRTGGGGGGGGGGGRDVHKRGRSDAEACAQAAEEETQTGRLPKASSLLSTHSSFEDCGGDTLLTQRDTLTNAESLAQLLVDEFRRSWLPSREPGRGRLSLRSSLQELPGTGSVAASGGSLAEEIRLRTRMRGSLSWSPPRFQIIVTVQPTHRRSQVLTSQSFLCAGCGTEVEPRYIRKLRYCEYLGRYFCDCCHSGSEAVIPGRVLSGWDFSRYPVSDFSKRLLDSVWRQPLFDLSRVGKTLRGRAKELDRFRELQDQLLGVRKLLRACRLSHSAAAECERLPAHLLERPHLFSMDDLLRVKKGQLAAQARAALHAAVGHVENCKLCLARGFICEFCRDRDVIFPFQTDACRRCPACKTCFHKRCFAGKTCPKCARIQTRKKPSV